MYVTLGICHQIPISLLLCTPSSTPVLFCPMSAGRCASSHPGARQAMARLGCASLGTLALAGGAHSLGQFVRGQQVAVHHFCHGNPPQCWLMHFAVSTKLPASVSLAYWVRASDQMVTKTQLRSGRSLPGVSLFRLPCTISGSNSQGCWGREACRTALLLPCGKKHRVSSD